MGTCWTLLRSSFLIQHLPVHSHPLIPHHPTPQAPMARQPHSHSEGSSRSAAAFAVSLPAWRTSPSPSVLSCKTERPTMPAPISSFPLPRSNLEAPSFFATCISRSLRRRNVFTGGPGRRAVALAHPLSPAAHLPLSTAKGVVAHHFSAQNPPMRPYLVTYYFFPPLVSSNLTSLLFLEHVSAPGPLHLLFPLSGMLLPQMSSLLTSFKRPTSLSP